MSIHASIQTLTGHGPGKPAESRRVDTMMSRGPSSLSKFVALVNESTEHRNVCELPLH